MTGDNITEIKGALCDLKWDDDPFDSNAGDPRQISTTYAASWTIDLKTATRQTGTRANGKGNPERLSNIKKNWVPHQTMGTFLQVAACQRFPLMLFWLYTPTLDREI